MSYWPIQAYPVLSVMHRQTTLNEQRHMQLVQAVKLLLMEDSDRNPLGIGHAMTADQVTQRVVVCFVGGSNGGHQAHWSTLRYPHFVHGCFCEVINPSIQRLYGEHDLGHAVSRLSGAGLIGATVTSNDFLQWNQYLWSQGIECHDISYTRLFAAGQVYRPACFLVADEDITSTGTDWVRLLNLAPLSPYVDHGEVPNPKAFGNPNQSTFAWMIAKHTCHQSSVAPVFNPYTGQVADYYPLDSAHELFARAVQHQSAQLIGNQAVPIPALVNAPRTSSMRGLDDPQEWCWGRAGTALPIPSTMGVLKRDVAFFDAVQPGSAGSMPGARESMFIREGRVYVGCADGFVSAFVVDNSTAKQDLALFARSPRLGHESFAMTPLDVGGTWSIAVGTRRHLHKLDRVTLQPLTTPVELPWEIAQPHHMRVGDILPVSQGQGQGAELVFASMHGGLVFCNLNLVPIYEWPEPGIVDWTPLGGGVVILSNRGTIAFVTFAANGGSWVASLQSASKSIPLAGDFPPSPAAFPLGYQGFPKDLELLSVPNGSAGLSRSTLSFWSDDWDGGALRTHSLPGLAGSLFKANIGNGIRDIAVCTPNGSMDEDGYGLKPGDSVLTLGVDGQLTLFDQNKALVGLKELNLSTAGDYCLGYSAHTLAVGELVTNSGTYSDEVVVATNTGLMWLHINDLLSHTQTPAPLPANYALATVPALGRAVDTHRQPRTNRTMSAAWAMAVRPNPVAPTLKDLHVIDQRGMHWSIDSTMTVRLEGASNDVAKDGVRNMDFIAGNLSTSSTLTNPVVFAFVTSPGAAVVIMQPWCPIDFDPLVYEGSGGPYKANNWSKHLSIERILDGFLTHGESGTVITTPTAREAWSWSTGAAQQGQGTEPMGNLIEGMRFDASGTLLGIWASTEAGAQLGSGGTANKLDYLKLKSHVATIPIMTAQSIQAVSVEATGQTKLVAGCPGGQVKIITPGSMRPDASTPHAIGSLAASGDLGYGGCALDVRQEANGVLSIWFGTIEHPSARPSSYGAVLNGGALGDAEVTTGAVHHMTYSNNTFTLSAPVLFHPSTLNPRGANGVIGIKLVDLLAGTTQTQLVVCTLSGDIILFDAQTMTELWRTHVNGAAGFYNSIVAEDIDNDGLKELYVGGSAGIWRFKQ